jgi:hypothetical protein
MDADSDRIPALRLTLDHYLPLTGDDWVRVLALRLDGSDVVVTIGPDSTFRVPTMQLVYARLSGSLTDPAEEVDQHMAHWYAGDLMDAEYAVGSHEAPATRRPGPRVAYGQPVPELVRDRSLVGIFGGDLDAVLDTVGTPDPKAGRARELRATAERGIATHEDGSPPDPLPDDLVAEELSSHYSGDLEAVPRRSERV